MKKGFSAITTAILLLIFIVFILQTNSVTYASEDNVTVDVNISTLSEITVTPTAINWTQVTPGQPSTTKLLDIKNTGSVNVTNIYAFVTTLQNETVRPYGSSLASNYTAGGVLVFHNESKDEFFWAGRLEWNWTETINNINLSAIDANSRASYGFFRNASDSYVWAVGNGTNGTCNVSDAVFALESDIDDGTAVKRTPTTTSITNNYNDSDYSYFSVNRGVLNNMCVAVDANCTKIFVYKYDKRGNFGQCTNSKYIRDNNLVPNDVEKITANVWMPLGIPAGDLKQAIWSFVAT